MGQITRPIQRRTLLRLTGALFASAATAGCTAEAGNPAQGEAELIEFDDPEELLLPPAQLPGDGWVMGELEQHDILDVGVAYVREFEDGERVDGDEGENWIVRTVVGTRESADEASGLYGELYEERSSRIGEARVMEFDLAAEAAVAGYDGIAEAIFRDANCVGAVQFTDCQTLDGQCYSNVGRVRELARTKQAWWHTEEREGIEFEADEPAEEDVATVGDDSATEHDLQFGDTFRTPTDLLVTAANPRLLDSYEHEGFGERETHEAVEGMQFGFVDIVVENDSEAVQESPNILDFQIIAAGTQYETMDRTDYEADDQYDGLTDLAPGAAEDGVLPYEVANDASEDELGLIYTDSDLDADLEWEAVWQSD